MSGKGPLGYRQAFKSPAIIAVNQSIAPQGHGGFLMRIGLVPRVLMAAILAMPLASWVAAADQPRTVVVSGNGESSANPDMAEASFAIETHAKTAADAADRNAALAQKVTDALKAKLGEKGKIWTGGYSLTPDYEQRQGREPGIIGYGAQNSITVQTGAMDLLGTLIDSAIAAGANRVNFVNFTLKNDTKARAEAIASAAHDAQEQAQALAAALNVHLKRILTASTESQARPIPVARYAMMAEAKAATPIEAGQITVPATVALTYEIE
jgi:uncharacterized protein